MCAAEETWNLYAASSRLDSGTLVHPGRRLACSDLARSSQVYSR